MFVCCLPPELALNRIMNTMPPVVFSVRYLHDNAILRCLFSVFWFGVGRSFTYRDKRGETAEALDCGRLFFLFRSLAFLSFFSNNSGFVFLYISALTLECYVAAGPFVDRG